MTKCIQTVVLLGVAVVIIVFDKEMFFSTEHLRPKGTTPLDFRSASIPAEPSAGKNNDVLLQKSTEFGESTS